VPHFLHVSTLAARVADISLYAKSKALAEQCVKAGKVAWTIVRLPAIYGPGDRETLAFFKAARGYWLPLSNPSGLLTLLHVHDACMAIVAALEPAAMGECYEVGDEQPITVAALAQAISQAVGGRAIACPIPRMLASGVAWANLAISYLVQREPMFTPAKVRELYHSDWSVCDKRLGALTGWQPTIPLVQGLNETSAWYQAQGWL
jgi:nucleoside-diphosphate-sugar epimerase